jgi:hypothetical protein cdiviTM7_00602
MVNRNFFIKTIIAIALLVGFTVSAPVFAEEESAKKCAGVDTSTIECGGKSGKEAIFDIVKQAVKILTMGVGVTAVGAVVYGGILFSSSGDKPENIKKAREIWINVVIGLLLYAFFVTLTQFLIPGGVFS